MSRSRRQLVRGLALTVAVGALPSVMSGCARAPSAGTVTLAAAAASSSDTVVHTKSDHLAGGAIGGVIDGTVRVYGGPLTADGAAAFNGQGFQGQAVTARSKTRRLTAMTYPAGRYRLSVPAGVWQVTGCGQSARVVVGAGADAHQDFACPVP
jgi:hypothetical protein